MPKSPEKSQMSKYLAEEAAEKMVRSIETGESKDYNEAEKNVDKKDRLNNLNEALRSLGSKNNPESFQGGNLLFYSKKAGVDLPKVDIGILQIGRIIEQVSDYPVIEYPEQLIHTLGDLLFKVHYFDNVVLPEDLKILLQELRHDMVNLLINAKQYGLVAIIYRQELHMPDKADEFQKLSDSGENASYPDLHLVPSAEEIFEDVHNKIETCQFDFSDEAMDKIRENIERILITEIDKLNALK